MKKIITLFIAIAIVSTTDTFAQSRKYVSQFSHMQGYFNPALTGYEGSMVKGLVRNQWAGWEGAPKTYFISAEIDLADLKSSGELGKNALGINLLTDKFGAFRENELVLSYSSRVQISKSAQLRLGAGVNINSVRLDGNNLSSDQAGDPIVMQYFGGFAKMNVLDLNLGLSLTHSNYYLSYGTHNLNQGRLSSGDVFMDKKPLVSIAQAGYRNSITSNLDVILNGMWRSQSNLPSNIEINAKAVIKNRIWIGGGHRVDYANNFQLGFLMKRMRLGYVYERPMLKSYLLPNTSHELMLSIGLFAKGEGMKIW
jgi:type IX secretion system PorP/SprF family membrane protein